MRLESAGPASSPPLRRWGWIGGIDMYEELIKRLRCQLYGNCPACVNWYVEEVDPNLWRERCAAIDAADAIEELFRVAKKMHLWIFLHSGDEQEAYDWCGLSDEMNAALGYGGQFEVKVDD